MAFLVALLLSVIALFGGSNSACAAEHALGVPLSAVDESLIHKGNMYQTNSHKYLGMRIPRARGAVRYLDLIATSSVIIATLFILFRCAAYIFEASKLSKTAERRLAEGDECEGQVSTLSQCMNS